MAVQSPEHSIGSQQVTNDIEGVALAYDLGHGERARLAAVATGAVPKNRDRPLYALARKIGAKLAGDGAAPGPGLAFSMIADAQMSGGGLDRFSAALVDFLMSMDSYAHAEAVDAAIAEFAEAPEDAEAVKLCAAAFARCLYRYRTDHMPAERHRAKFIDLARFFKERADGRQRPEDGDALEFWCGNGTRERWTKYETVLEGMVAYSIAYELRHAAMPAGSWLENDDDDGTSVLPWESAEFQALASESLEEKVEAASRFLNEAELKILKETELTALRKLAGLNRFGPGWARSGLTLLSLAPHQASLVQLEKDRADAARRAKVAACESGADYRAVLDQLSGYASILNEARGLAEALAEDDECDDADENPSEASKEWVETKLKESRLMRRKSFKTLTRAELSAELDRLLPALTDLHGYLSTVSRFWLARFGETADMAYQDDRARFSGKLLSLYLSNAVTCDD